MNEQQLFIGTLTIMTALAGTASMLVGEYFSAAGLFLSSGILALSMTRGDRK